MGVHRHGLQFQQGRKPCRRVSYRQRGNFLFYSSSPLPSQHVLPRRLFCITGHRFAPRSAIKKVIQNRINPTPRSKRRHCPVRYCIALARQFPTQRHRKPAATLPPMYRPVNAMLLSLPSNILSFTKVENVVKPPQNPVVSSSFVAGVMYLPS